MGKLSLSIIAAGVAASLIPGALFASQDQTGQSGKQGASTPPEVRGSKLIGTDLTASDGSSLGQVQDLVINPKTGKVDFAIVGVDTGNGAEALAPIPWQALNLKSERSFSATIDKQKLQSAPKLSPQQWSQLMQPDYTVHIYEFYGVPQEGMGGNSETPGGTENGSGQSDQSGQSGQSDQSAQPGPAKHHKL